MLTKKLESIILQEEQLKKVIYLGMSSKTKYNRLELLEFVGVNKHNKRIAKFKCDCGVVSIKTFTDVKRGHIKSCGCLQREIARKNAYKDGRCDEPEYCVLSGIKDRCLNKKNKHYDIYGGRGIKITKRWLGENGYRNFKEDMGERPTGNYSIDRIDNDGGYEPKNCRWATTSEQANNRSNNTLLTYKGETHNIKEWGRITNQRPQSISQRLHRGKPIEEAIGGCKRICQICKKEMKDFTATQKVCNLCQNRKCLVCGQVFKALPKGKKKILATKYCSRECYYKSRRR